MRKLTISSLAVAAAMFAGSAGQADVGWYYGGGLGYSSMESDAGFGLTSETDVGVLGLTLGYRWESGSTFYGAELDADVSIGADFDDSITGLPCTTAASGPYWCSHDATVRLRGLVGQTLASGYEVFATGGLAVARGDSAIGPSTQASVTSTGYTVGLGTQREFGAAGYIGRLEVIYDRIDNSNDPGGYDPDFEAVTLKASILF